MLSCSACPLPPVSIVATPSSRKLLALLPPAGDGPAQPRDGGVRAGSSPGADDARGQCGKRREVPARVRQVLHLFARDGERAFARLRLDDGRLAGHDHRLLEIADGDADAADDHAIAGADVEVLALGGLESLQSDAERVAVGDDTRELEGAHVGRLCVNRRPSRFADERHGRARDDGALRVFDAPDNRAGRLRADRGPRQRNEDGDEDSRISRRRRQFMVSPLRWSQFAIAARGIALLARRSSRY